MTRGLSPIKALLQRLASTRSSTPPPALRGLEPRPTVSYVMDSIVARVAGPSLEERVTRDLVPLVRAAAAEEQAEVLRGEASIAAAFAPTSLEGEWGYGRLIQTEAQNMFDRWNTWNADVTQFQVTAPATAALPEDPAEFMRATMDMMLAQSQIPAWRRPHTEPIYLTRQQIDQVPRAQADEFLPWNPAASLLAGLRVVEVMTVEESTPHREGWLLTVPQVMSGALRSAVSGIRYNHEPVYLTHAQLLRVMAITGQTPPGDWEQTLDRGGEISRLCNRPVFLADRPENSTPCIERWMDL